MYSTQLKIHSTAHYSTVHSTHLPIQYSPIEGAVLLIKINGKIVEVDPKPYNLLILRIQYSTVQYSTVNTIEYSTVFSVDCLWNKQTVKYSTVK